MCYSQVSYIKIKAFGYFGEFQVEFCKNLAEFYPSPLKFYFI